MEGGTPMEGITTAFTTAIGTIKTDALEMMGSAVPVALSIAGISVGITLGWKLFKKLKG